MLCSCYFHVVLMLFSCFLCFVHGYFHNNFILFSCYFTWQLFIVIFMFIFMILSCYVHVIFMFFHVIFMVIFHIIFMLFSFYFTYHFFIVIFMVIFMLCSYHFHAIFMLPPWHTLLQDIPPVPRRLCGWFQVTKWVLSDSNLSVV